MAARGPEVVTAAPRALPLYLRAALPAIPVLGSLPGIRHHGGDTAPDLHLRRTGVTTDPDALAAYTRTCGFRLRNTLPLTYPHLAAFGLQLRLMTDTAFPFAPMGAVHVSNSIVATRPLEVDETYDVDVVPANLRPHPAGRVVDLVSTVTVGGETVWTETSTYLSRGRRSDVASDSPLDGVTAPEGATTWRLGADLGRRYAAVSGDRNPIHLYGLTAKALGFPRQIAHGMWTKARCLAALEERLPRAVRVDVDFKKPVLLPGSVAFGTRVSGDETVFGLTSRGSSSTVPHLVGRVQPA